MGYLSLNTRRVERSVVAALAALATAPCLQVPRLPSEFSEDRLAAATLIPHPSNLSRAKLLRVVDAERHPNLWRFAIFCPLISKGKSRLGILFSLFTLFYRSNVSNLFIVFNTYRFVFRQFSTDRRFVLSESA